VGGSVTRVSEYNGLIIGANDRESGEKAKEQSRSKWKERGEAKKIHTNRGGQGIGNVEKA